MFRGRSLFHRSYAIGHIGASSAQGHVSKLACRPACMLLIGGRNKKQILIKLCSNFAIHLPVELR